MSAKISAPSELHVVLASSGGVGSALVRELVSRGYQVRAVSRTGRGDNLPAGVELVAADVTNGESVQAVASGATVVYHAAQPDYTRWPEELPAMTEAVLNGVAATRAKLVMVDNLYMYGPHNGLLTEDLPYAATDRKGRVRAATAIKLLEAHANGQLRVTIGRLSDYYGAGGLSKITGIFPAALLGQPAIWFGRIDQPHTLSYLPDVAKALITLAERDEANGQAWHLPAAEPLTGQEFLELVYAEAGTQYEVQVLDQQTIETLATQDAVMREFAEIMYQNVAPFVVDASRYQQTFGPFKPTPHREAIRNTLNWYREHSKKEMLIP